MNHIRSRIILLTMIFLLICSLSSESMASKICKEWVAKVVSVQGTVQAKRRGETQWEPVESNNAFCISDMLRVQERSRVAIVMSNDTIIRLDQNTTITFTGVEEKQTSLIEVLNGVVHFFSRTPKTLKVITPFVNAAVEGTEFLINVDKDKTVVTVFEGQVKATNNAGSITLASGQSAIVGEGQAPVFRVTVRPRDAVQWALYYLPILHYRSDNLPGIPESDWQSMFRNSIRFYTKGDLSNAFSTIEDLRDVPDPIFLNYRATLLLSVGRVDEARNDIKQSLSVAPENSHALSLQSIIAVVQNEKEKALNLAEKAVKSESDSATARIALSYSQQANFKLKHALTSLREAVKLDPENSLAWARLAELRLSFGNLDKALEAAKKAVELNPDLAHTQTVLGFVYLMQIKVQKSMKAFETAIELDQAAPLPRLGLGLANIRKGKLEEGRREIEIAASLDPNNSLIRSYLGKSFYEEKRDNLAKNQYIIAKELDPLDPTSFFYSAIQKQSLNRPVDALYDLQKAIELNDNRAVYRSRQLLDEDLAARSASLARIYDNLGFQQLALVEGWKSVNTDPGSHSAHRLLADSYSVLPRHEIARVSELLQSQLHQPLNTNPVQPHLGESDLLIREGTGPGDLSFNEFNPLFNSNGLSLQASGVVGENRTRGEEIVVSALKGKTSISAGQYHYESVGFRENNDIDQDIYNLFTQLRLSHKTSIQAEYRYSEVENGDMPLRFDIDDFSDTLRQKERNESIRLGFNHVLNSHSSLTGSFIYGHLDDSFSLGVSDFMVPGPPVGPGPALGHVDLGVEVEEDDRFLAEGQYLLDSGRIHITAGVGHFDSDRYDKQTMTTTFMPEVPPFLVNSTAITTSKAARRHSNIYLYSLINYPETVTWTLGASADHLQDRAIDLDIDRINPKLGLTWNPHSSTTIRAAAFRVLTRTLVTNQTLEPTQVAGFNQFFDDVGGTEGWRYGTGVDQKLSSMFYGGMEFSNRDLDVPYIHTDTDTVRDSDWREQLGRIYFYLTPLDCLGLSLEYQFERIDRAPENSGEEALVELHTNRLPVGINLFHPLGLSSRLKATYVDQKGEFGNASDGIVKGRDRFWIVDASFGYRLPKRWGIITIEIKNLFDEEINFQDTDPAAPQIYPERIILARLTLAL